MRLSNMVFSDSPLFVLYCVLILWLPIPFGSDALWAQNLAEIWVLSLFTAWLLLYASDRTSVSPSLYGSRYLVALLALWVFYLVCQQLYTVDVHITTEKLLLSVSLVLFFVLTLVLCNSHSRIRTLMWVIVFAGLFQAIYGSLMTLSGMEKHFFMDKWTDVGRASGTFVNSNHFAAYLVMSLSVGIGLMISSLSEEVTESWKHRLLGIVRVLLGAKMRLRIFLIIMVIALVLSRSRMGNTVFFMSLLVSGGVGLVLSRYATRATIIFLTSIIIIDIFIVGAWFGIDKIKERMETTSAETELRDEVNRDTYRQWQANKIWGTGLGTYPMIFPHYRGHDITGFHKHTHNDYLQFAAETGLVGIVLLAFISLYSLCMALIAQHKRRHPLMRGVSFAAMMGIIAMLIHATVEFNFQIPANAAMFMVLLAFASISRHFKKE